MLRLVGSCDALVENFRPGQLDRLGLSEQSLKGARPDLVVAHISGFGQDGPYRDRAAFGVIGEAIGGLRYWSDHPPGVPDLPPVRVGISIGDSIAGIFAAFGIMAAVWQRDRVGGDRRGHSLDVALTDASLSLMEGMLPEYSALGSIRQPTGSRIPTAAPSNAYPTADGKWILIAANSDPLFARLARLMEQPQLIDDIRFKGNQARVQHVDELDAIIATWSKRLAAQDADDTFKWCRYSLYAGLHGGRMCGGSAVPPSRHGPGSRRSAIRSRPSRGRRAPCARRPRSGTLAGTGRRRPHR